MNEWVGANGGAWAEAPRSSSEGASRVERRRFLSSKRRVFVHSGTDKTYF